MHVHVGNQQKIVRRGVQHWTLRFIACSFPGSTHTTCGSGFPRPNPASMGHMPLACTREVRLEGAYKAAHILGEPIIRSYKLFAPTSTSAPGSASLSSTAGIWFSAQPSVSHCATANLHQAWRSLGHPLQAWHRGPWLPTMP